MPVTMLRLTPVAFALLASARAARGRGAVGGTARRTSTRALPSRASRRRRGSSRRRSPRPRCRRARRRRRRSRRHVGRAGAPRPEDAGAVFLRADRLEGTADKSIEASGKVELRTRRETVLADWLRYDFVNDEIWAKGDVADPPRPRLDHRARSQVPARHGNGLLRLAALLRRRERLARQRDGDPVRGPRPLRGVRRALHDLRRAAQGLVHPHGRARGRQAAQGRHRPRRDRVFLRRAGDVFAVARVSAVERAQVGVPHADDGSTGIRGFEYAQPVLLQSRAQLRRDDHAAPHDQARRADRRPGPLPVRAPRRARPAPKSCRTTASPARPLAAVVEAQRRISSVAARARRLLEPQQGLRRHVFRRSVRPRRAHVADDAAARRRIHLLQRAVDGARARAGVPDAAGPDGRRSPPPTTACRRCSRRCARSTGSGSRSPASANTRISGSRR